jgi:uncharacterized membrane protein YvlD (DUF360 family)
MKGYKMKKFIRAILKLPLTPFVLLWFFIGLVSGVAIMIIEWLYEDKSLRDSTWGIDTAVRDLKKWFTTI